MRSDMIVSKGSRSIRRDDGLGIVTVIMVMAVLTALATTGVTVAVNNLGNARSDRQSLSALASSEAGVAQAIQKLRGGALSTLTCTEPVAGVAPGTTCQGAGPSWISATNPMQVNIDGTTGTCGTGSVNNCFRVWIGTVSPYVPKCAARIADVSAQCFGVYRIHSTGVVGSGPGARAVAVDVRAAPYPFPIGVFSESFSGNGNVGVHHESLFSNGCVTNRQRDDQNGSGFRFQWDNGAGRPVLDTVYDQPVAAHATGSISTSNNSCGFGSGGGPIHLDQVGQTTTPRLCNTQFKYDQDVNGGALTAGDGCYGAYTKANGAPYPTTSTFTSADLQKYGYRPRGLTDAQYDALRTQAQGQDTYNPTSGSISATLSGLYTAGIVSPVLFWDNGNVALNLSNIPAVFKRNVNPVTCTVGSLTIVVINGNLSYSGGNTAPYLVASTFVPDGTLTGLGGFNNIGTVFANVIDLGGNPDYYMDSCFADNPPGATLDVQVMKWREDDGKDIN